MKKAFDMSNLGLFCFYLSAEVRHDSSGISLHQTHYAKRIHELSGMTGCNPAHTSMEEKLKLSRESTVEEAVKRIMRYVAGTLDYGLHYRRAPNTAWFVGYYDSDLTDDVDTSKNTTRTMFFLGDCLVS
ncbi:uncharacterized mitochondrial protein AtMg00810-like [Miscanthus floridulus]|uniref:uncharacterized mitochondrial protein AtMg00810-like n=1 Tax=Miscanthus floridulus TaxID=154761 RepID=UPI003459FDCC